jgi:hypothetical protein
MPDHRGAGSRLSHQGLFRTRGGGGGERGRSRPALAADLKNAHRYKAAALAALASQAKDWKRRQEVCEALTYWKKDADMASVRDPAWLAAMPPDDRQAWEALWRDVDAVLASVPQGAGPPAKP